MKKFVIENVMKLKKLGEELDLRVGEISIGSDYLSGELEILPDKLLGIKISNGGGGEIVIEPL